LIVRGTISASHSRRLDSGVVEYLTQRHERPDVRAHVAVHTKSKQGLPSVGVDVPVRTKVVGLLKSNHCLSRVYIKYAIYREVGRRLGTLVKKPLENLNLTRLVAC